MILPPTIAPDYSPMIVAINSEWLTVVIGLLLPLVNVDAWGGTQEEAESASEWTEELIDQLMSEISIRTIGEIKMFAGSIPDYCLACDGSTYSKASNPDYEELYNALDDSLIIDSDYFQVPDLTERSPYGHGGEGQDVGDQDGEKTHLLTISEMPSHTHDTRYRDGSSGASTWIGLTTGTLKTGLYTLAAGGSQPHNNLHPVTVVRFGIVYK